MVHLPLDQRRPPVHVAPSEVAADGGFVTACVCGQPITVPGKPDAVGNGKDLRVTLRPVICDL